MGKHIKKQGYGYLNVKLSIETLLHPTYGMQNYVITTLK